MTSRMRERQRSLVAIASPGAGLVPRAVPFDAPWSWLAAGWRDMWQAPAVSLGYGGVFAATAALIGLGLTWLGAQSLYLPLAGGFLLIGPLLAVGLYEASRRIAAGEHATLASVAGAGLRARGQLLFFGVILMLIFFIWLRLAFLILMLFLGGSAVPPPDELMRTLLFTPHGLGLLVVGSVVGGGLAAAAFAMSVVAVPMLLERDVDAVTAIRASVAAVIQNPAAMALWAALIVVMIVAGFATLLLGLVLAFPLIGHATWHAHQQIYAPTP